MNDPEELRSGLAALHRESFGWALACCRGEADLAQEVLQTAYAQVLAGRAPFRGDSSLKTWFFSVVRRVAASQVRRRQVERLVRLRLASSPTPAADAPSAAGRLEEDERLRALRRALARLPARQRQVLHLVFYGEMTIEHASRVLGVSLGAARAHYERGKRNLRRWLRAESETR